MRGYWVCHSVFVNCEHGRFGCGLYMSDTWVRVESVGVAVPSLNHWPVLVVHVRGNVGVLREHDPDDQRVPL